MATLRQILRLSRLRLSAERSERAAGGGGGKRKPRQLKQPLAEVPASSKTTQGEER